MSTALPTATLIERLRAVKLTTRVYYRQSLGEDKQQSIATQEGENKRLAQALGLSDREWERAIVYPDVDRSGSDFSGREQLTRLLQDAKPGDLIVTWRQDRLGRDMLDASVTVRELVKHRRCHLFTCETGLKPVTMDDANETFMVVARGFGGQSYLENMRKNTRDGLRQRARDGFASGKVPFGYRTVLVDPSVTDRKKSKKRIEIDDKLAPVVRRIFTMYLDGRGYTAICKALNSDGAPSPRGKGWSPACVWDMLREPRYVGEWSHGERRVLGRNGKKTVFGRAPEEDIIRIQRPELAIIPRDEWARVQAALASRTRDMPAQHVSAAAVHMLSGFLKCDECGTPMRIKVCKGRRSSWSRRYYVCPTRLRTARCSNATHLPADETEQQLLAYLRDSVLGEVEEAIRAGLRAEVQRIIETAEARTSEAEQLRSELESLRRERLRLVRLAAATDDPVPEVVDALSANQERARGLADALAVATRPPIDPGLAERLEAAAVAQVERMRQQLTAGEVREALTVLCPAGLRFKIGAGLWRIEGAASVPTIRNPDKIRISDPARRAALVTDRDHSPASRHGAC